MTDTWLSTRNILAIRLDALGDVLMTTPALKALKGDGRSITLLTSPSGALVAPMIPEVDRALVYESPWMKATPPRTDSRYDRVMADQLRQEAFDGAVIFTVFSQNPLPAALLAYLADIPLRLAHCRENPYQLLTDWIPERDSAADGFSMRHEVQRQLDLVGAVGFTTEDTRMSLRPPAAALEKMERRLPGIGLDLACPWVVIHPGSTAASRRYAPQRFAEAARRLALEHGWQVVFTGSGWEYELVETIRASMGAPSLSLAGQLDLAEMAALLDLAPLLITNNTGPAHMAAALGTPVVDLYALTNPQHTPWGVPSQVLYHDVPCKNCFKSVCPLGHHDCLSKVSPAAVVEAALSLSQEASLVEAEAGARRRN